MLSEFGPTFLFWLMRRTSGFYDYLESWAVTLGVQDDYEDWRNDSAYL